MKHTGDEETCPVCRASNRKANIDFLKGLIGVLFLFFMFYLFVEYITSE